jgi:uncharacterized membrane protein YhaH (DUF805 family)
MITDEQLAGIILLCMVVVYICLMKYKNAEKIFLFGLIVLAILLCCNTVKINSKNTSERFGNPRQKPKRQGF